MASMDRLVELFVQSARYGESGEPGELTGLPQDGAHLDAEGCERGVEGVWKMLSSEEGARMGMDPSATFVCIAMALEEKPLLQAGAARCYEKALELVDARRQRRCESGGSWERSVVLQQLGTVCLRQDCPKDGARWLDECIAESAKCQGHPRDAVLFSGAFNTKQTRLDFIGTAEKFAAKAYHDMGDQVRAQQHYEEVQRLSRLQSCDAVERAEAQQAEEQLKDKQPDKAQTMDRSSKAFKEALANASKALWAVENVEERRLSEYRFVDEGSTVLLILDLNDHLGIGEKASSAVDSLAQFRVNCTEDSVDVRVRLNRENGATFQFQLLLEPLVHQIVPEDTVPKLKGRDGKRRLEVKLFKHDKKVEWRMGDLVKTHMKVKAKADAKPKTQGTMLNPLSAEQIAQLPRPGGGGNDNRTSSWQGASRDNRPSSLQGASREAPVLLHKDEVVSKGQGVNQEPPKRQAPKKEVPIPKAAADATVSAKVPQVAKERTLPTWVERVEERSLPNAGLEIDVHLGAEAGEGVGMEDLELEGDDLAGLRVCLRGAGSPLILSIPSGTDVGTLKARWRRKTRVLELRLQ